VSGQWRLSKFGKVEASLQPTARVHPFELNCAERCFFLRQLLTYDADYLTPIWELIHESQYASLKEIEAGFQPKTSARMEEIQRADDASTDLKRNAQKWARRIASWKRTSLKAYVDHIVPPRIHWLLDLRLLDWETFRQTKQFELNPHGVTVLQSFPQSTSLRYIDRSWLEEAFFEVYLKSLKPKEMRLWKEIPQSEQESLVDTFLSESFDLFRTTRIPRITASQFLLYTCIRLACDYHIACGFNDLKLMLQNRSRSETGGYRFRWSVVRNDGYILKT
jgi:hypothetical protein